MFTQLPIIIQCQGNHKYESFPRFSARRGGFKRINIQNLPLLPRALCGVLPPARLDRVFEAVYDTNMKTVFKFICEAV
jgi:hypothetical protein